MLTEICGYLRNWFEKSKYIGIITIENGDFVTNIPLTNGQYIRIIGSLLNDGVYLYDNGVEGLKDETFEGAVWGLAIPKEIVTLANDIKEWTTKNSGVDSAAMSPFQSESFGGYEYSKAQSYASDTSAKYDAGDWKSVFATRLSQWRKI